MAGLPRVSEYMDTKVQSLSPDMDIHEAVNLLLEYRITGAPVVDERQHVIGILSEYDCLRLLAHGNSDQGPVQGKVRDYMSHEVKTVPSRMNVYFVAGMFLNDHIRRFPVVDEGRLVGTITRFDILRAIRQAHGEGNL